MVKRMLGAVFSLLVMSSFGMNNYSPEMRLMKLQVEHLCQWGTSSELEKKLSEMLKDENFAPDIHCVKEASRYLPEDVPYKSDPGHIVKLALGKARKDKDVISHSIFKELRNCYQEEKFDFINGQEIATITGAVIFLWELSVPLVTYCIEQCTEYFESSDDK